MLGTFFGSTAFTIGVPTSLGSILGFSSVAVSWGAVSLVGAGTLAGLMMMAGKDPFVEYQKQGMSQKQKEMFQREIENYKYGEGRGGADNLTKKIIREIAELIRRLYK